MRKYILRGGLSALTGFVLGGAALFLVSANKAPQPEVIVYKTSYCGCCKEWVTYLQKNNFSVKIVDRDNLTPIKKRFGVPQKLQSCHTARVGGYTIEGHVPAADIRRLLKEKPKATGLAVPGMPVGSPGMGEGNDKYNVVLFGEKSERIYSKH